MNKNKLGYAIAVALFSTTVLTGCGGSSSSDDDGAQAPSAPPETSRAQDERSFTVPAVETLQFEAVDPSAFPTPIPDTERFYGIYDGLMGESLYAVEIPENWNGGLVMYTHGYSADGVLGGQVPNDAFRAAVLQSGYAWAGSSYSADFYDVRAAIEDTNKLATEVMDYLLTDWGVQYDAPDQILIAGYSLGGHTAAAAVDRENMQRTLYPVDYAGAMPMCQAEQNQFQWLGDYARVAQHLAGYGYVDHSEFQSLIGTFQGRLIVQPGPIVKNLFELDPNTGLPTWEPANLNGERLMGIAMNLTGGDRPIFEEGFKSFYQNIVFSSGGGDGTINGILDRNLYDNTDRVYRWTTDENPTAAELAFNEQIERVSADAGVNSRRDDGVRWIPRVEGDFDVPVMTMHTLGDLYVPFRHQQLYREGAIENGNSDLLVQRAIRAAGHCDFSATETMLGLTEFLLWVNDGPKPAGNEVLDPAVVADPEYGCEFTRNDASVDRSALPSCSET